MTYRLFDSMIEKIESPVICVLDGEETRYASARELLTQGYAKKYEIANIKARNGDIVITLRESSVIPNDLTAEWAKEHMANTGEEISFF